jgi:uncharacterized protein YfaS (alpha-2-macroglobulin family)
LDGGTDLYVWVTSEYIPDIPGDQYEALNEGFVTTREHLIYDGDGYLQSRRDVIPRQSVRYPLEQVVEEHVQVINPESRAFVAVRVPLASGFEPMNPELATAPREAFPKGRLSLQPSYADYADDSVTYYYDTLPAGTFDFYFRTRASFEGRFVQPPARTEMMYDLTTRGRSNGARIEIYEP